MVARALPARANSITWLLALRAVSSDSFALAINSFPFSDCSSFSSLSIAALYCCRALSIFLFSSCLAVASESRIMFWMLEMMELTSFEDSLASLILA